MVIHIPYHPAMIAVAGTVIVFVIIKSIIEIIPL